MMYEITGRCWNAKREDFFPFSKSYTFKEVVRFIDGMENLSIEQGKHCYHETVEGSKLHSLLVCDDNGNVTEYIVTKKVTIPKRLRCLVD